MARTRLYQVFDKASESVLGPIIAVNKDAAAVRTFQEFLGHPESPAYKYPDDYELHCLGEQDTNSGAISAITPERIYTGSDWTRERARTGAPSAEPPADGAPALTLNS